MDDKIKFINKNQTWPLNELPVGEKKIRVKMVYEMKYNEHENIHKYNARLVVKAYSQKHEVGLIEINAPEPRMDTVRMIIAFTSHKNWQVFQLDVKSTFFHGELRRCLYREAKKL